MTRLTTTDEVKRRASTLGFDAVGIASLEPSARGAELDRWLAAGYAGTMSYLHRQAAQRREPARIMPAAKVAVVTLTNYFHGAAARAAPEGPGTQRVAQYAWSADYHDVLGRRLEQLAATIRAVAPAAATRCYVDAGPVPERELAERAGLGWIGKNMMLIHPALGSFTFIGVVLTDADLAPDLPFEADRCGTCRRCLDACPTEAFVAPHVLDARRCISYLTIEHRGDFTADQRALVGDWVFGCDVCQDVCPSRGRAPTGCGATPPRRLRAARRERGDPRNPAPPGGRPREDRPAPPSSRATGALPHHRRDDPRDHLSGRPRHRGCGDARREAAAPPRFLLQRVAADRGVRDRALRRVAQVVVRGGSGRAPP
jgi:epoxyqueuosine reductase